MSTQTIRDIDDADYALGIESDDDGTVNVTAYIGDPDEPETFIRVSVNRADLMRALGA